MHTPCRDIEDIPRANLVLSQRIHNRAICYATCVLLGSKLLFESSVDIGIGISIHYIPHLRLARTVVLAQRHRIVGVHLHAEIRLRVDKLDQ